MKKKLAPYTVTQNFKKISVSSIFRQQFPCSSIGKKITAQRLKREHYILGVTLQRMSLR